MQVMTTKAYNEMMLAKWHEDVEKWGEERDKNDIIPQIAFYFFPTQNGLNYRKTGYVAITDHGATWAKTKHEVIAKVLKG
jgi:hypothetical protein